VKKLLRMLFIVLLLGGSTATIALADGTDPPPTCDPFSNPHCMPPPPSAAGLR
jgi:hypothetical protein